MLARKTEADPLAPSARYRRAYARWSKGARRRNELTAKIDGIKLALSLTRYPGDATRVAVHLKEQAAPYFKAAEDHPKKLARELAATVKDHDELRAREAPVETDRWEAERRLETNRIARELQPAHRDAARDLAAAVEALSEAIHAERAVRAELRVRAPLAESAYLPDLGRTLGTGALSDVGAPLWRWRRQITELKILEQRDEGPRP